LEYPLRFPIILTSAAALALAACDSNLFRSGQDQQATAGSVDESHADELREALKGSVDHGLTTDLFFKGDIDEASAADLRGPVLEYASALAMGKVDPTRIRDVYTVPRPNVDVEAGFDQALSQGRLLEWLGSLAPQTDEYRTLSRAFIHYAKVAGQTPDTNLPPGEPMKQGSTDPRVPALVEALKAGGYMQQPQPQPQPQRQQQDQAQQAQGKTYTAEVAAAVKRMQEDFGLEPDGVVGNDTLKAVNTSARDRARQLAVALERLRWLEREPPATRIDVNTAATFLTYFRNGQQRDHRRVVVGEPGWETPQLGSPIFRLVANPAWTVPNSIVEDEISKKSGAWLRENNFVQKNGRWIQQPGPKNALGEVKFDMRNGEAIYLHDTPAKALFEQDERHRSHGCVRVQGAIGFARMLASENNILDKFNEALASSDETFVDLPGEILVRLLYHTAFVGPGGRVGFAPDVYGWDNDVAAALGYQTRQRPQIRHRSGGDVGP
jgi:L,D-transpeptidase YcbB